MLEDRWLSRLCIAAYVVAPERFLNALILIVVATFSPSQHSLPTARYVEFLLAGIVTAAAFLVLFKRSRSQAASKAERHYVAWFLIDVTTVQIFAQLMMNILFPLAYSTSDQPLHSLVVLAPILNVAAIAIVALRLFLRADEFLRKRIIQAIGVSFAVTSVAALAYGYLEATAGLPQPPLLPIRFAMGGIVVLWLMFVPPLRR